VGQNISAKNCTNPIDGATMHRTHVGRLTGSMASTGRPELLGRRKDGREGQKENF